MAVPVPLLSLSNELKGLIEFFEALFAIGGKGVNRVRRYKAGKAAENLHGLHFPPGGFRQPLENIAAGATTNADTDTLAYFYAETGPEVAANVRALNLYVDVVRTQCGAAASAKLEELIRGNYGKFVIREEIEQLVQMTLGGLSTDAELQAKARRILDLIERFNANLIELHDMIFPPSGAPK